MTEQINHSCPQHRDAADCPDALVGYSPRFDEYGIWIRDGENARAGSRLLIRFCPWCGRRLPKSRRAQWFRRLKALGYENPLLSDDIPVEFLTDAWYREAPRRRAKER